MEGLIKFGIQIVTLFLIILLVITNYHSFTAQAKQAPVLCSPRQEALEIINSGQNLDNFLAYRHVNKNIAAQTAMMDTYTSLLLKDEKLEQPQIYVLNNFITYGVKATGSLNQYERYKILANYKVNNKHLPISQDDWVGLFYGLFDNP